MWMWLHLTNHTSYRDLWLVICSHIHIRTHAHYTLHWRNSEIPLCIYGSNQVDISPWSSLLVSVVATLIWKKKQIMLISYVKSIERCFDKFYGWFTHYQVILSQEEELIGWAIGSARPFFRIGSFWWCFIPNWCNRFAIKLAGMVLICSQFFLLLLFPVLRCFSKWLVYVDKTSFISTAQVLFKHLVYQYLPFWKHYGSRQNYVDQFIQC